MLHHFHSGDADAHLCAEWLVSFDATPLRTNDLPQGMKGIGAHKAAQIRYLGTATRFDSNPNFHEARQDWRPITTGISWFYIDNVGVTFTTRQSTIQ